MKPRFSADDIWDIYERNLRLAKARLQSLPIYCGTEPTFRGLPGWVFEQAVQYCLKKELRALGFRGKISEQATLTGRAKADLHIGNVLIEIKLSGAYDRSSYEKYAKSSRTVRKAGLSYLWFSGEETYAPCRVLARKAFGRENTFYMDSTTDWQRFVRRVESLVAKVK